MAIISDTLDQVKALIQTYAGAKITVKIMPDDPKQYILSNSTADALIAWGGMDIGIEAFTAEKRSTVLVILLVRTSIGYQKMLEITENIVEAVNNNSFEDSGRIRLSSVSRPKRALDLSAWTLTITFTTTKA